MIRVLIVDDQPLLRSAVASLLADETDIEVIGEAESGERAVELARELVPDVTVMDLRMPGIGGVEATRQIAESTPPSRVLVLTTFEEDQNVIAAFRAGAGGFIGKDADPDSIAEAVRTVHRGEALLSPTATRALIARAVEHASSDQDHRPLPHTVTDREREVLRLVGWGLDNDAIADRLFISATTAKTHVNRLMTKLDAHDRARLVIHAYESGLVAVGTPEHPAL
jgi:DNA-binding NarL/FixJ family response regulator